jgi:DNA replication protein DnaC
LNIKKDLIEKYIKYDFENYFNIILNEAFKTKNLFLFNLSLDINNMVITYIAKKLINEENSMTKQKLKIKYYIYENLIQLSLRSNIDKTARDNLNDIICKPDVLFIDNLGIETGFGSNSKHNVKLLQLILKERNNKLKSTVISSKLYFDEIENQYGKDVTEMFTKFDVIKGD